MLKKTYIKNKDKSKATFYPWALISNVKSFDCLIIVLSLAFYLQTLLFEFLHFQNSVCEKCVNYFDSAFRFNRASPLDVMSCVSLQNVIHGETFLLQTNSLIK